MRRLLKTSEDSEVVLAGDTSVAALAADADSTTLLAVGGSAAAA
jgi:hypothetical protein